MTVHPPATPQLCQGTWEGDPAQRLTGGNRLQAAPLCSRETRALAQNLSRCRWTELSKRGSVWGAGGGRWMYCTLNGRAHPCHSLACNRSAPLRTKQKENGKARRV